MKNKTLEVTASTTKQDIFNFVSHHLLNQGKQSLQSNSSMCAYRGESGRMCAIGCLIPDDIYDDIIEGSGIEDLLHLSECEDWYKNNEPVNYLNQISRSSRHMLSRLQSIHDDKYNWTSQLNSKGHEDLIVLALEENLNLPSFLQSYFNKNSPIQT